MSESTTKVIRAVTIRKGESFTLPPGSTIMSSTGFLTSACDIPPITELGCYEFRYGLDEGGGNVTAWEPGDVQFHGVEYGGVFYPFSRVLIPAVTDIQELAGMDLVTTVADVIGKSIPIMLNTAGHVDGATGDRGNYSISFRTPASIASSLFLVAGAASFGNAENKTVYLKAISIDC